MRKLPTGLAGVPSTARGFRISTANKRCPLNNRAKCTARFVGGVSAKREIELDTSVLQSVRDQCVSSVKLCNALSAAGGSAAMGDELSIDVTLLIPKHQQTKHLQTKHQQTNHQSTKCPTEPHSTGQTGTVPGVPALVPESKRPNQA